MHWIVSLVWYFFLHWTLIEQNDKQCQLKLYKKSKISTWGYFIYRSLSRETWSYPLHNYDALIVLKWNYDPHSYERNSSNCVKTPEEFWTSTEFEPVTLRCWCNTLSNGAMPQILRADHLWVQMFWWWLNQWMKWYMKWIVHWTALINSQCAMHHWAIFKEVMFDISALRIQEIFWHWLKEST